VLPTPVTQPPTAPRTSRGDSSRRTAGTSRRDTSADDHSRSGSTRRDADTPPSRTSDGSESRQRSSDRTPDAGTNASRRERDTAEAATECATPNSFVPGTPVLLADGTYKPIEQIKLGDRVLATDPTGNLTQGRPVIALIPGQGLKKLVRITVDTDGDRGNATGTVTATDEHPFWEARTGRWTDAEDLDRGNLLRTPDGRLLEVVDVHEWAQQQQVHNLTVDGLHTYYVNAGGQDLLTHNCSRPGDEHLDLHYKDGWDADQIAAADGKVAHLDNLAEQGKLVKTKPERVVPGSAAQRLRNANVDVPDGHHGDHLQDLQLGGTDTLDNLGPLDGSVNTSLGPQIAGRVRNLPLGTTICGVSISGRC
jgi:hypothetical protein